MITAQPVHECQAIIGHEAAREEILSSYDSGRMHHAWLLTGPVGVGKASLAHHIAHMVLSGGENRVGNLNPNHEAARLIMAQSHPDLLTIERPYDEKTGVQKTSIPVDEARKLAPFLSLTSSHGKGRVAIIDEAHMLNRNGQNAILKMIEEPPTGAFVILTATTVGMMLPTIKSRCRVVAMDGLKQSEISTILARQSIDVPEDVDAQRLYSLARGSVGQAIKLLESEAVPLFDELMTILLNLPTMDLPRIHKLADQMNRKADQDKYDVVTGLLVETLQNSVRALASNQADPSGLSVKLRSVDKALKLWEKVKASFAAAETGNLDKKLTFINALSQMSKEMA